jgi:hypothetical protein
MKVRQFNILFLSLILSGIITLAFTVTMKMDMGRGNLINYDTLKTGIIAILSLVIIACIVLCLFINWKQGYREKVFARVDTLLAGSENRFKYFRIILIVLTVFFFECFLVSYIAFPVPMRPLFVWLAFLSIFAWFLITMTYRHLFPKRTSIVQRIRSKWNEWSVDQRKVALILIIIGIVYFLAFVPINMFPDQWGAFHPQDDEKVLYPDVTRLMEFDGSFSENVRGVIGRWGWQWGYPYFTASASVLVIPRLIFGSQFAKQVSLNIGLLRQFISVLPMIIAILLGVYLVTKFKSRLLSIGMFLSLLLMPGVVKNNQEYWHPDSLIIFCIVLTIFFLRRDDLRFKGNFYLAAAACGLATALKLWGLFFVAVIGGYLLAGLVSRKISIRRSISSALLFLLIMVATVIISSPPLMAPFMVKTALKVWELQQTRLLVGPSTVGAEFYEKDLFLWLQTFGNHFMKPFFFFFSIASLVLLSLVGPQKYLNRIILGWSLPVTVFLVYIVAMKNFQYTLQVGVPLYMGAFILPMVIQHFDTSKASTLMKYPWVQKITWSGVISIFSIQFAINLVIVAMPIVSNHFPGIMDLFKSIQL